MRGDGLFQSRPRLAGNGRRGFNPVENALHALFVHREQQRLLAGNVKIDRARRHGGRGGKVAHAGGVVAALGELGGGGIEQCRPFVGLTLRGGHGHARFSSDYQSTRLARMRAAKKTMAVLSGAFASISFPIAERSFSAKRQSPIQSTRWRGGCVAAAKATGAPRPSTNRSGKSCSTSGATSTASPPPMTTAYHGMRCSAAVVPAAKPAAVSSGEPNRMTGPTSEALGRARKVAAGGQALQGRRQHQRREERGRRSAA